MTSGAARGVGKIRHSSLEVISAFVLSLSSFTFAALTPANLRTEWLPNPLGIDAGKPRVSWRVESDERGQRQTGYRVLVASGAALLERAEGDLWDSGKVASDETLNIEYAGKPLASGQACFWKVKVWDKDGVESPWSAPAHWSMGLLKPEDWKAQWISFKDETPLHTDRAKLHLPPARHYRKEFSANMAVKRVVLFGSALGVAEFQLNGQRVGDAYLEPGWADYRQRNFYRVHDVTKLVKRGPNCVGAIVADGWYAGYVGYGLLVGYGPNKTGRAIYGKTPALLAQLDIEYADGSHEIIGTDTTWQTSGDGPIREADLLMGVSHDARQEDRVWCQLREAEKSTSPKTSWKWQPAIRAEDNGSVKAKFFEPGVEKEVELGFQKPAKLVAYTAPPIRVTEELPAKNITEPKPGVFIFDLAQNIAGIIRLKVKGAAGTRVQIRYGEMLHRDGTLMTENLRKARATDFYTLRGDADGETWQPRFTYHGFQFVELTGLAEKPALDAVTGLVLNNDTPIVGDFACSDETMTQFWRNTVRTQKANFIEIPTDCPQRDERLGWMGDAQIYARTASYNADVAAFFTKWIDDVREAQRDSGAYPDYAPYPFAHGAPGATHGTAWTDAGVIVPYTMWQVYGDTRLIARHWDSMVRFMDWRAKADPDLKGVNVGNTWGDWLNVNEVTPIEFIDLCYHAYSARLMRQMAGALGRSDSASDYSARFDALQKSFRARFVKPGDALAIATQTACVLAQWSGLADGAVADDAGSTLSDRIAKNDFRMATGFLGTKALLAILTMNGQHDLACRIFQSRKFPSWGYEVEQGATSVWERWDSFTKEHGFDGATGKNNAAMNSFSHYAFGAVMQWAFQTLAGIDTDGPGFKNIIIRPHVPSATSNPDGKPLEWVRASYEHPRGRIACAWKRDGAKIVIDVTIPTNTTAAVHLPSGKTANIGAGKYHFEETP
jgi:alpha-L-rhamnosidase